MNKKLNKVELKIFGEGGRYICIDALDKDSIMEIYDNLDKGEVINKLARLSWDYSNSITGRALCRICLRDGSVIYDIIQNGNSDMYPDLYPVVASIKLSPDIIPDGDSHLSEYQEEINERLMSRENYDPEEWDYPEQYYDYYTVVEEVLDEHNTSENELMFKAYEDSLFTDYVFNDNFSDIIDEIYEKGMQL